MKLNIKANSLYLSYPFKTHLRKRLYQTFESAFEEIQGVTITFSESKDFLGDKETVCELKLAIQGLPAITVHSSQENLYKAFMKCLDTAYQTFLRQTDRRNQRNAPVLLTG